jgi:O-antigen ligase
MLALMPLFEDVIVAMGKDATLTGRIPIWHRVIDVMTANRTMTGFGYGMFWRDPNALIKFQTGFSMRKDPFMATLTTGAHNVIMEMWLNSGLLGLAAFFFMVLYSFRDMQALEEEQYMLCLGVMAYLTINGLTERCLGGNYDYKTLASFLVMAVACSAAGSRRRGAVRVCAVRQTE